MSQSGMLIPPPDIGGEGEVVASIQVNSLTANRLVQSDGSLVLASVSNLASWVAGTGSQVTVTNDGDGTITLSLPQNIATTSSPTFVSVTATTSFSAASGTVSVPGLQFTSDPDSGLILAADAQIDIVTAAGSRVRFDGQTGRVRLKSDWSFGWESTTIGTGSDLILWRSSAGILQQSNGTGQQQFWMYGTTNSDTSPTNYERIVLASTAGSAFSLLTQSGGSGTARALVVGTEGATALSFYTTNASRWSIDASGHLTGATGLTLLVGNSTIGSGTVKIVDKTDGAAAGSDYAFSELILTSADTTANGMQIKSPATGTGHITFGNTVAADRGQIVYSHATDRYSISAAGVSIGSWGTASLTVIAPLLFTTTNTHDIGQSITGSAPRSIYVGTDVWVGNSIYVTNGSAASPSLKSVTLTNTGLWTGVGPTIGLSISGVQAFSLNATALTLTGNLLFSATNTYDIGATAGATCPRTIYAATSFSGPIGTVAAASFCLGAAGTGLYSGALNADITFAVGGVRAFSVAVNSIELTSDTATIYMGAANDVRIARDAANVLALKNGAAAQALRAYGTYTDASNYERLEFLTQTGTTTLIQQTQLGTGVARTLGLGTTGSSAISFYTANTSRWQIGATGHLTADADNTYDGGAAGATRMRTLYLGTAVAIGTNPAATGAVRLANLGAISGRNAANSADIQALHVNAVNEVVIGGSGDIRWGVALIALGGGAAPTLGTIGGSGPATAAQNSWMRVVDSAGAAFWVPAWK